MSWFKESKEIVEDIIEVCYTEDNSIFLAAEFIKSLEQKQNSGGKNEKS